MDSRKRWDEQRVKNAVSHSFSKGETLRALGLPLWGGNYTVLNRHIRDLELDTSHFDPRRHLRGKPLGLCRPLNEILVRSSPYTNTSNLKKRLLTANLLQYHCSKCGISDWQNEPLSLHLDHINGISDDNRIENLRLLCPNCHSQTPTYAGRAKKKHWPCKDCGTHISKKAARCKPCSYITRTGSGRRRTKGSGKCCDCCQPISPKATRCRPCLGEHRKQTTTKIQWPPIETLFEEVSTTSYLAVGRRLGVSDNAVRKHLSHRGVEPPRKWWRKVRTLCMDCATEISQNASRCRSCAGRAGSSHASALKTK